MTAIASTLPAGFADLQPFVPLWANATAQARLDRRLDSTLDERRDFYAAMAPRAQAITEYLNDKDMRRLSPEDGALFQLLLGLAEVALTEEVYGQHDMAQVEVKNRLISVQKEIDGF